MTVDNLKNILNEYFEIDADTYAHHLIRYKSGLDAIMNTNECDTTTDDIAEYIFRKLNEQWERAAHLLNVGDPVIVGGYISKVEVLTDVVRYHLENGAVIEMERSKK